MSRILSQSYLPIDTTVESDPNYRGRGNVVEGNTEKWDAVLRLFENDLHLLRNPSCRECDAQIRHPLLPWMVGRKFDESAERVLFVGKLHRDTPGNILKPSKFIDARVEFKELWCKHWPYWSYTRKIAESVYGRQASDSIALTNLVKCTNVGESKSSDRTTRKMVECCVRELGVIWKEIEILQPKTLLFYTYGLFRDSLQEVPIALKDSITEITPQDHRVPCGKKMLGWWERSCRTSWTETLRFLVVGHPERMKQRDFVKLLANWIRPDSC